MGLELLTKDNDSHVAFLCLSLDTSTELEDYVGIGRHFAIVRGNSEGCEMYYDRSCMVCLLWTKHDELNIDYKLT